MVVFGGDRGYFGWFGGYNDYFQMVGCFKSLWAASPFCMAAVSCWLLSTLPLFPLKRGFNYFTFFSYKNLLNKNVEAQIS